MSFDQDEAKKYVAKAYDEARGFRRWLARFADEHPNTTAGYVIVTFPFALYGAYKFVAWMV